MSHKADIDTKWQLDQLVVRPLKKKHQLNAIKSNKLSVVLVGG